MLADPIRKGLFVEIPNQRDHKPGLAKMFRLRRTADGAEFAIEKTGTKDIAVWSSVSPADDTPLAKPAVAYTPGESRNSNLQVMPKLSGSNKHGTPGAHAWKLQFKATLAAYNFIVSAR